MSRKPSMICRQKAVQATMDRYRFRKFDWKAKSTCLHLARFHLRQMGKRPPALPQIGSLLSAKKALKERGWSNVGDMLDGIGLKRIPPAAMLLGDLAMLESADGIGSIVVSVGGKVIGWHDDDAGMVVMEPLSIAAAWRL